MNPIQLLRNFLGKGITLPQIVNFIASRNPMVMNLANLAKNGDSKAVETFARNLYKDKCPKGDFDKDFEKFRNNFNGLL